MITRTPQTHRSVLAIPANVSAQQSASTPVKIASVRATRDTATGSSMGGKSKMSDLPRALHDPFRTRFVPLVRQHLGTATPWKPMALQELQDVYCKAFGAELASQYPLNEGDHCFKLVSVTSSSNCPCPTDLIVPFTMQITYRMNDWHGAFASTAVATFKEIIENAGSTDLTDPDGFGSGDEDANESFAFTTPEEVGIYAKFLLGDMKKAAPFYWKEWNEGRSKQASFLCYAPGFALNLVLITAAGSIRVAFKVI